MIAHLCHMVEYPAPPPPKCTPTRKSHVGLTNTRVHWYPFHLYYVSQDQHLEKNVQRVVQVVQSTRPSEGTYLEQIAKEMGPMQFFAQRYAECHTKSLVCSVGWNHVLPPFWGPQTFYMLFRGLKQNALSKNHFFCNLFYVQLCTDWTKGRYMYSVSD